MKFNLSPSALNIYNESQLIYYFQYIVKAEPDVETNVVYSISGNIVHDCLKLYTIYGNRDNTLSFFNREWYNKKLDVLPGFNNNPLDRAVYEESIVNGMNILDGIKESNKVEVEKYVSIPLVCNNEHDVRATGIIDLLFKNNILDWKTSSRVDEGDNFKRQGLHYAYLMWYSSKFLINNVVFEYVKINKRKEFNFTIDDIYEYDIYLKKVAKEIIDKGVDIDKYELGTYESPFNNHIDKCRAEASRRKINIGLTIKGANIYLDNPQLGLVRELIRSFSYELKNAFWIKKHMLRKGVKNYQPIVRFYNVKNNSLPIGFYHRLLDKLKIAGYIINIDDKRVKLRDYEMSIKLLDRELRDYQKDATNFVMDKKITFLHIITGAGKTTIAAEIIRRCRGLMLFITDRNVLLNQTTKEFKNMLGMDIGNITEGKMDIKVVNVATIQTLNALIKNKNKQIINFLQNIKCLIIDESYLSATNSYTLLSRYVSNAQFRVGLGGNYERPDGKEMDIESVVGRNDFKISALEMIDKRRIMRPNIYFLKCNDMKLENISYMDAYQKKIVDNEERNSLIKKIVERYNNKNILIIVNRVDHGKKLEESINNSVFIHGGVDYEKREEWLDDMKKNRDKTIIGTSSIVGRGLDLVNLDILINATGNDSFIITIQSIGRILRTNPGKENPIYFDFYDQGHYFLEHSKQRIKTLEEQGYIVKILILKD